LEKGAVTGDANMKLLHCSDLHLSNTENERAYCLSVLDDIAAIALREGADYLLFSGDTFNSFTDAEALRDEFRKRVQPLSPAGCETILISGNHEELGRHGRSLTSFDLGIAPGCIIEPCGEPFAVLKREGLEFLAVPHRDDYRDYTDWKVPGKEEPFRVALAHGIVAGMSYLWEDEENDTRAAVMDSDIFQRNLVDYAALGHIHSFRRVRAGETEMIYPGSARVWRKNETGPRQAVMVSLGAGTHFSPVELKSAGQYRSFDVFVNFHGVPADLPVESAQWGSADYVFLKFSGLVENERESGDAIRRLVNRVREQVRRVEYEQNLFVLEGVSIHPVARKFLMLMEEKALEGPGKDDPVWKRAREMGLMKIKQVLEARP